jgi:hypothetical protein
MSRSNNIFALVLAGSLPFALMADDKPLIKIQLPKDSPVTLVSADMGDSKATPRGGAMEIEIHTSLSLRNAGSHRIRGVTLLVLAQEVTPGGKGSVAVPSLNVAPGDDFPVKIDLRLLRPLAPGIGPMVQVMLDGVLFDDLSFFGENRLNSRRTMTQWELEARRDRKHFRQVLESRGPDGLQKDVLESMARQAERPKVDVKMARSSRATAVDAGRQVLFSFLRFPDSPVEPHAGMARVIGNEARAPSLEVINRSDRAVKFLEIGWIIRDRQGRDFMAATVPADLKLAPGQSSRVLEGTSLQFSSKPGQPVEIESMFGFVKSVEFSDGSEWIPARAALADPRIAKLVPVSPEEQRLTELYRRKGLAALIEELKK